MSTVRDQLKRIPGMALIYRAARSRWWRLRAALPLAGSQKHKLAARWGEEATHRLTATTSRPRAWLDSPQVLRDYVFPRFGGSDWYAYLRDHYGPRASCLSLCCGDGAVERNLLHLGVCQSCEGIDISPVAIAGCRSAAEAAGLHTLTYRVADAERLRLSPRSYDLVISWMGLHHLQRPGRVLQAIRRVLRPGGILVVNEYVGPNRFQLPSSQVELINRWLQELPPELRRTPEGGIRERFQPPTMADVLSFDPSEAVSSAAIVPLLKRHFIIVEQIDYGGVLLHWLLQDLMQNFDPGNAEHRSCLEMLYRADRKALSDGYVSPFTFVVAQTREA